jgi:hypothetical protein
MDCGLGCVALAANRLPCVKFHLLGELHRCVFNIKSDEGETVDLATINPGLLQELRSRFFDVNATQWNVDKCPEDNELCESYVVDNGGFFGPYLQAKG